MKDTAREKKKAERRVTKRLRYKQLINAHKELVWPLLEARRECVCYIFRTSTVCEQTQFYNTHILLFNIYLYILQQARRQTYAN